MSGSANNPLSKVVSRIFPKVPDFYSMLEEQSALAVKSAAALLAYTETGDNEQAELVRSLEHEADEIKERNIAALNEAFSTPMDREDLYRAIQTIDHVLNYAKTTVREMQVLGVEADDAIREMAGILLEGVVSLDAGYKALPRALRPRSRTPLPPGRPSETPRRPTAGPGSPVRRRAPPHGHGGLLDPTGPVALRKVMDVFKKREVYRHMSNAADRLARAGESLRDIVVKLV
ncbi:MAG: DUF47 family protein [Actinomycetales bacterium]|nr:DUF47 family protein [Candidatus Phosphoribacter baldrii]